MSKNTIRSALAICVLLATILVFVWYFKDHPEVAASLRRVPLPTIALLFLLYVIFMGTLIWIQRATLALCDLRLGRKESSLLVMYSSVINFFGPLQSGPAFRAAYLKARYNLHLGRYAVATLAYYGFYAAFSGILLVSFFAGWWVIAGVVLTGAAIPLVFRLKRFSSLNKRHLLSLALATASQVLVTSVIYFIEIHSLLPAANYFQALAYTGAANFALFVSITPGAIGFRESFLLFSQKLHGIGSDVIAAASLIDRSVYILLLLVIAAVVFGMHANEYFRVRLPEAKSRKKR